MSVDLSTVTTQVISDKPISCDVFGGCIVEYKTLEVKDFQSIRYDFYRKTITT